MCIRDRDAVGFRVGDHFRTARELLAEFGVAPGGDDLEVRGQGIDCLLYTSGRGCPSGQIMPDGSFYFMEQQEMVFQMVQP